MNWSRIISFERVLACFSAGVLFYLIGISCDRDAEELKSVMQVDKLKDLAPLVNVVPLVVAVSGRVGSDEPIECKCSNAKGVIVRKWKEHHFLERNDKGEWEKKSTLVDAKCTEVPWYLDDSTSRVYVVGGGRAWGLELSYGGGVFEEWEKSPSDKKLEEKGIKMVGVKKSEHVLPIGASLTVIGEAFKDETGAIAIKRPDVGPFYVTYDTVDKLIEALETCSELCNFAYVSLMVIGFCLIAMLAFEYIWRSASEYVRRRRFLQESRRLQESQIRYRAALLEQTNKVESGSIDTADQNLSDVANEDKTETNSCKICFEQEYNSVFVPCGHLCCCMACSLRLIQCPVCRAKIKQVVRTFRT